MASGRSADRRWRGLILILLCGVYVSACAPKAAPAVAGAAKHPDFMFPIAPDGTPPALASLLQSGWRYLQLDDLRSAERDFGTALKQQAAFYPADAALGYAALARRNPKDALTSFDRALQADAGYVPGLVGRGQAYLELDRDMDALASFEAALARDASLTDLQGRVDVLRFRAAQALLARATAAAEAGRLDEAQVAYQQAIAASPESAFLYRELAAVEHKAGRRAEALAHYRKATELDPGDARSHAAIGGILDSEDDVVGALAEYERARLLDPAEVPDGVMADLRSRAALAKLPAQYRAIPQAPSMTRADIAALVGIRLERVVASATPRQMIITDVRGQWALAWINAVVRAGIMDTQANYQFDPAGRVRRGDLALIVSRIIALVATDMPDVAEQWQSARVEVSDVAPTHLSYPAVSTAVAAGVMPLKGGAFDLLRGVTGAEAIEIMGRLERIARR